MNDNKSDDVTYAELRKIVADLKKIVEKNDEHLKSIDQALNELRENQQDIDNKLNLYGSI